MRRTICLAALVLGVLGCGESGSDRARAADKEGKGTVVELDSLRSTAPADWKEEEPSNRMRFNQFRLPKKGDDKHDAELVIFKGLGGSARDNIKRWKGLFTPPEGKEIDDVAKVEEIKIGGHEATFLDVRGTYLMKTRPFDPSDKGEKRPDYRMLAIHFDGPKDVYHIRMVGPAKTIEAYKKGFDEWVKGFKKE
jgi:hypothetical protein